METLAEQLRLIGLLGLAFNVPAQLFLLALQADAYRRYRHASFVWLLAGSLLFIASTVFGFLPMISPFVLSERAQVMSNWVGLGLSMVGAVVAISGAAQLFRRYGQLLAASGTAER